MGNKKNRYLRIYFIRTYMIFWLLITLTGLLISLNAPILLQNVMKNLCSYAPTIVVFIMFKKLYPGITIKEYFNTHFKSKTNIKSFTVPLLLQSFILFMAVAIFFVVNTKPFGTIEFISASSVVSFLLIDLTGGALGEELGWRGYALNTLQKKYSPLVSSLLLGLIWGFWHLPLMLLSGYTGVELIYYITAFMFTIVSLSVIITFFYNKSHNILIAMWMHFLFNFFMKIVVIDFLSLLIYVSVGYVIVAIIIVSTNRNQMINLV